MRKVFLRSNASGSGVLTALAFVALTVSSHTSASAEQTSSAVTAQLVSIGSEDDGSSERINNAGKLRMLSQRVVAASCYLQAGIASDASRETLISATAEFDRITDALEFGDANLGIHGAEERRRTLAGITKLREVWAPVQLTATTILDGSATTDDVATMAAQSAEVLDIAIRLTAVIADQYTTQTTILQTDTFAIDIAGRQRMLAQRISKNVCLISSGINIEASTNELNSASGSFEAALYALRNGSQEVGIRLPPNSEIEDGLNVVIGHWEEAKPLIAMSSETAQMDEAALEQMFGLGNQLTGTMNSVVGLYSAASKMGS